MRPLCCGMRSHPSFLSLTTCLHAVVDLSLIILSAGCLVVLILPRLLPWPLVGSASVAPPERCIRTCKLFGNGRASASMNAVSRDRFTPAAAADAVTPTYLRATAADFHPKYPIITSMAVPSMLWLAAPPLGRSASCTAYIPCQPKPKLKM